LDAVIRNKHLFNSLELEIIRSRTL